MAKQKKKKQAARRRDPKKKPSTARMVARVTKTLKRAKKTNKTRRLGRRRDTSSDLWMPLSVEEIARDPKLRDVVARLMFDGSGWPYKRLKSRRALMRWRPYDVRRVHQPVQALIVINAYLTDEVPEELRRQKHVVRGPGEALLKAADMYLEIYRRNARKGGEPVYPNVEKRVAKRRREARGQPVLLRNRGFEPYVWGHDLGDLVFENIYVTWKNDARTEAVIEFGIGS